MNVITGGTSDITEQQQLPLRAGLEKAQSIVLSAYVCRHEEAARVGDWDTSGAELSFIALLATQSWGQPTGSVGGVLCIIILCLRCSTVQVRLVITYVVT
jgi:hypothetical protein